MSTVDVEMSYVQGQPIEAVGSIPARQHQRDEEESGVDDAESKPRFLKDEHGWLSRRILLFTPSWFSVNMGTGIVSILLHNLPYQFTGLKIIATVIYVLNIVLFLLFLSASLVRYLRWPRIFILMITHDTQAVFLGTFSMGFSTIVNMTAFVCIPAFGSEFVTFAWTLWWINAVIALLVGIGVPWCMFNYHELTLEKINATILLPVVSPIVVAATGGIVAEYLPAPHARLTIVISYILWGSGFPVALLLQSVYLYRLTRYHLPPGGVIVSAFLPLGPCGQGAFALLQFSAVIRQLANETGVALGGASLYDPAAQNIMAGAIFAVTIPIALVIWGLGLFWLILALASVTKVAWRRQLPFNMGWWGFTFPLGVFTAATTTLGKELDSGAFKILGTVFSVMVFLLWLYIGLRTLQKAVTGEMFVSPCLGKEGTMKAK